MLWSFRLSFVYDAVEF